MFATIIADEMVIYPESVFPAWAAIPVAIAVGVLIRRKVNLLAISIIGVTILYFTIYVGSIMPLALPGDVFGLGERGDWIILLYVYAGIASLLPVWLLLQPRDYINGAQLVVGLFVLYFSQQWQDQLDCLQEKLLDGLMMVIKNMFFMHGSRLP